MSSIRCESSQCAVRSTLTQVPDAALRMTPVSDAFDEAVARPGVGTVMLSPRLPLTESLRTRVASTRFFLCAAMISSDHKSGTKPAVASSDETIDADTVGQVETIGFS